MAKPSADRRKELLAQYRHHTPKAGVLAVLSPDGRYCLAVSNNILALQRRERFQLELGSHPCKALQQAWNKAGGAGFDIAVLKELKPKDRDRDQMKDDLEALRAQAEKDLLSQGKQAY